LKINIVVLILEHFVDICFTTEWILQCGLQWRNPYRLSWWPGMWFKNVERGHPIELCNYSV